MATIEDRVTDLEIKVGATHRTVQAIAMTQSEHEERLRIIAAKLDEVIAVGAENGRKLDVLIATLTGENGHGSG